MPAYEGQPGDGTSGLGAALVVEDNIVIALEIDTLLRDAGADNCFLAGTVENALLILKARDIAFGIVDVSLGLETGEQVGLALRERALPFALLKSYGETVPMKERFDGVPVIVKPVTVSALHAALRQMGVL